MPTFTVRCSNRKTGKPYSVQIEAATQAYAEAAATAEGHLVETSGPPASPPVIELQHIHAELVAIREQLANARIVKWPISTVAWGIITSGLILIGVATVVWLALGLLTTALK